MLAFWLLAPLLAVLPIAPSPSPSASPGVQTGLIEIAHVQSSACQPMLTQANAAIDAAMLDDTTIVQTIRALHMTRLNGTEMDREKSFATLDDLATQIDRSARDGNRRIKALRAVAATTSDPAKKQELLAFANALGGAIGRQDAISQDVSQFIRNLQERDAQYPNLQDGDFMTTPPGAVRPAWLPDDDAMAAGMATDFISRMHDIATDETTATSHAEAATAGC